MLENRSTPRSLRRLYDACWVLFGLGPSALALVGEGPSVYLSCALLAALGLGYAALRQGRLSSRVFLFGLIVVLGSMSALLGGAASLLIVSLPLFWIYTSGPRPAIVVSGLATLITVFGGVAGQGWSPDLRTGNVTAALIGYAASVLVGLWMDRLLGQSNERAARLAAELAQSERRLVEAHRREGAAAERERLARDIHDTLAQGFASIIVLAEAARADPARSAQRLDSIEQTARDNLTEARALVGPASSNGVSTGTVADTLRRTLDRFAQDTGIVVEAELADIDCDLLTRIALLRCTQESLANVRKHAAASTVGVLLTRQPGTVELEITDDGSGFAMDGPRGFGLDGMRARLRELGGELTITSSIGDGTRIHAALPTKVQV
ncbi:sensor histidine kinase [Nocardia sp. NPDC051321]|uniref:sensor histidine kinase n=1 Tax=Nocardia sp. NPDC051321 TaxID=3364323 RepID=UPI003796C80E